MTEFEKDCYWHFAPRTGGIDQGPNDAMGDTFKKLPYEALVRESIQNSLDATIDESTPVIVTFRHSCIYADQYPNFLKIREHIAACLDFYKSSDSEKRFNPMLECIDSTKHNNRIYYLEVSDENTKGMSYTKGSTSSPFYAFVKSVGNSVKDNKAKGGSKGYGKAAYLNASKIRTMFISTLTTSGQYVFEGVSALCTHKINGKKVEHYGYFTDAPGGVEEPITDKTRIPRCFCRKTVGTSAYIFGVDYSDKGTANMIEKILTSAVVNFWAAIVERKLEVRIVINGKKMIVNASTIFEIVKDIFPSPDDTRTYFSNPRPYMDAFYNVNKDFNHIKFEKVMPTLGNVELFLTRTQTGTDTFVCMRSPLMLVKAQRNRTNYGFYGVFICRNEKGNEILRSMEEGSHTEWNYKNCSDKNDREKAEVAKDEIQQFLDECIAKVFRNGNIESLTFGGLEDILSISTSLEDEDYFCGENESFLGDDNGDRTESYNTETTTDIDKGTDENSASDVPERAIGQVIIYEGTGNVDSLDGGDTDGGDSPEAGKEKDSHNGGDGKGRGHQSPAGSEDGPSHIPGDGQELRKSRLNVRYRAFAQSCSGGGYCHRLVITSNRSSERAIVEVLCAGESSNEAIAIKKADQGSCSNNVITNVKLQEGRNVINIWFDDDMRHSIKLTINEE